MSKVDRAELAAWRSVAKDPKPWVAQTVEMAARAAMYGLWPTVTLHRFWLFEITRIVAPKMVFTEKEKTCTDVAARI
jgi:hypothetical protein